MKEKNGEWNKVSGDLPEVFKMEIGQELVGKYQMVKKIEEPFDSNLYFFEIEKGKIVSLWGASNLDSKMSKVKKGAMVKIIFTGTKKLKGRKQPMKCYDVYTK